jgi:AsmA family protein
MFRDRLSKTASAVRAWSGGLARRVRAAPWRKIGIWTGGVFGVLVAAFILFVTFADWNALKGPISRMASAATGRAIVIRGDLDVNPWSWTPDIHVTDLYIGNPAQYRERGAFAVVANAEASVRWLPLFAGRFDFTRIDLNGADVSLYRSAEGVSNWSSTPRAGRGRPFDLPAIREFALRDGRLRLEDDKRRMVLEGTFTTEESVDPRNPGRFALNGEGRINGRPFTLELTGAPLLNVRRDRPYNFVADVLAGGTRIEATGAITRPFNFNGWFAEVRASGPDLADLYPLTGLTLPNTPPYNLTGRVERNGHVYGMPEVGGRVGDSDVRGHFTATRRPNGRLFLDGDFRTNSLDFDDLLAVLGGPPDTDETASAEQRAMAANLEAQGRLLPDAQLDISRVRNMDARVSYRAARVRSERFPLRGLSVDINLDNGLLRLDPMTLQLTQGRVGGAAAINARQDVPLVNIDVRLADARMESIFRVSSGEPPLSGVLMGRARLTGRGASVRDAAANAHGEVTLVTPSGEVREALAELTGINVVRGLGLLLTDDQSTIGVRCGVASFRVENGIARARSMVIDTDTMLIRGEGHVDLRDETIDIDIQGEPKEARLIRFAAPISLEGRLRSPDVGVEAGEAAGQTGIAAALATLVAPLAAVLPFVDAGLAEDANCAALLAGREVERREG